MKKSNDKSKERWNLIKNVILKGKINKELKINTTPFTSKIVENHIEYSYKNIHVCSILLPENSISKQSLFESVTKKVDNTGNLSKSLN